MEKSKDQSLSFKAKYVQLGRLYFQKNFYRNTALALGNVFLIFALLVQSNFIGFFATGYEGAALLLDLDQEDVEIIEIHDPDLRGKQIRLIRQEALPASQWHQSAERKTSFFYSSSPAQYRWRLEISKQAPAPSKDSSTQEAAQESKEQEQGEAGKETHKADIERIAELFAALSKTRRYYDLPRPSEKEKEKSLGMHKDSQGKYAGLHIKFVLPGAKSHVLYVGRESKNGSEVYVRLDDESKMYLVRSKLRARSGGAKAYYFRDRSIFGSAFSTAQILSLKAVKTGQYPISHLVYNSKEWTMQYPPSTAKVRSQAINSFIQDLRAWKAVDFPLDEASGLDKKYAFDFHISYKEAKNLQEKTMTLRFLGRKGYNSYIIAMPDSSLREFSSTYIEDFLSPKKNFLDTGKSPK